MLSIINRHLLARYSFLFLLVLFSLFGLIFTLSIADEISRRLGGDYTIWQATIYKLKTIPIELYEFIPLVFTLTAAIAVGSLAKSNELTIIRLMATNSFTIIARLLVPFILFIPFIFILGEYLAPQWANQAELKRAELRGQTISQTETLWFTAGDWIGSAGFVDINGNVINLKLFKVAHDQLEQIVIAERAEAAETGWTLINSTTTRVLPNNTQVENTSNTYLMLPNVTPEILVRIGSSSSNLTLDKLANLAEYNRTQSVQDTAIQVALWTRYLVPLEIITMLFIGLAISMVSFRQRTIGDTVFRSLGLALAVGFLFDLAAGYMAIKGLPAALAVALPFVLTLIYLVHLTIKRL